MTKATATLKSILAARRMSYVDLARASGLAHGTVKNLACGTNSSARGRRKIEQVLGGIRIWTAEQPPGAPIPTAVAPAAHGPCSAPADELQPPGAASESRARPERQEDGT
jgi:transcriptional regulator with XRE-family HTH domain